MGSLFDRRWFQLHIQARHVRQRPFFFLLFFNNMNGIFLLGKKSDLHHWWKVQELNFPAPGFDSPPSFASVTEICTLSSCLNLRPLPAFPEQKRGLKAGVSIQAPVPLSAA